jgi:hypothetical protein
MIARSADNPVGHLAEQLFCKAFGWSQAGNSHATIDAVDKDQIRYQIKDRRLTRHDIAAKPCELEERRSRGV